MDSAAQRDVFISYTGADRAWAVWVEWVLRDAGYSSVIQEYDFVPGESFLNAMNQALARCRWVACLLSPAYLVSRWCTEEWLVALKGEKLLPLRIAECTLPPILDHRAYVDLVGLSEDAARDSVLAALARLKGLNSRPTGKPSFPTGSPPPSASRPLRFPGTFPAIWNIPIDRNPHFTGRSDLLAAIRQGLGQGNTATVTQAIHGLGGVGKTQVALEYVYRHASDYDGVWWLRAEEPATLAGDYVELAGSLGIELVADQNGLIREVRRELSRRQRFLLVFDNATNPESLSDYLPQVYRPALHWGVCPELR